ncbi:hypothetical protein [Helicobacter cholecystus]|uniref:hypothetical protein n=1 Tax=Helicobacter cholecystus TaxID=45498 RepID=UPI0027383D18|nr:hypothetical protein [Helicobacter cholecystus]
MSQHFIFYHQDDLSLIPSSQPAPIVLIPSSLCLQTHCPLQSNPLEFGYSSKLLDLNSTYLCFNFPLANSIECFYFPTSSLPHASFAMLDLVLPPLLGIEYALFAYESSMLFCYYQNNKLTYSKPIHNKNDLTYCLALIQKLYAIQTPKITLFDYGFSHPYTYDKKFILNTQTLNLSSQPSFIILEQKAPMFHSLLKFILLTLLGIFIPSGLLIHFAPTPAPTSIIPHSKNLNISYPLYSLLALLGPQLSKEKFLKYQYTQHEGLILFFSQPFSPKLLQLLHSKGYKTNILDLQTLRILL